jgi:pimeloyl-ACP methyl ester carboxylesterase
MDVTTSGPVLDTPVVLVHGYGSSTASWLRVERSLRDAGFSTVRAMGHHPLARDIPTLAARLVRLTNSLAAATGSSRVHLVGHSLGGLIIRYAVCVLRLDPLVDTAITVATPHRGSRLAWLALGTAAGQCRPNSAALRRMQAADPPSETRWIAYYADRDLLVPISSAAIGFVDLGAENVLLTNESHLSILFSPRLAADISARLAAATPAQRSPGSEVNGHLVTASSREY